MQFELVYSLIFENEKAVEASYNEDIIENKCILHLSFSSMASFLEFMQHPSIGIDMFFDTESFNNWQSANRKFHFTDYIKNNPKIPIIIKVDDPQDVDKYLSYNIPITLVISNLPFTDKVQILNNPNMSDIVTFLDKYTDREVVSYQRMLKMYKTIYKIAKPIKDKGYSQAEALYAIYNKVREKEYNEESVSDKKTASRSLASVLEGQKIVCAGFTNYFIALSDYLLGDGIAEEVSWFALDGSINGHSSVIVFLNDQKYGLKIMLGIDPTWDAKKDNPDYKLNIRHLFIPIFLDIIEKEKKGLGRPHGNPYHSLISSVERKKQFQEYCADDVLLASEDNLTITHLKDLYARMGCERDLSEPIDIDAEVEFINKQARYGIPLDILEQIIATVTPQSEDRILQMIRTNYNYTNTSSEARKAYNVLRLFGPIRTRNKPKKKDSEN